MALKKNSSARTSKSHKETPAVSTLRCLLVFSTLAAAAIFAAPASATVIWDVHTEIRPTTLNNSDNAEVQKLAVHAEGGNYTLTFNSQTTTPIPYNATAAELQSDLNALGLIGTEGVTVAGGPAAINEAAYTITFTGVSFQGQNVTQITANSTGLTGTGAAVTLSTETNGSYQDQFLVVIENIGDSGGSGTVTVTDTLPSGITTATTPVFAGVIPPGSSCSSGAGQTTVTCTFPADGEFSAPPNNPEGISSLYAHGASIAIPVAVSPTASGTVTNSAEVSGVAPNPATATTRAAVNTAPSDHYTLNSASFHLLSANGLQFSQAAGRLFAAVAHVSLGVGLIQGFTNTGLPSGSNGASYTPLGGLPRTFIGDLPLGLIGNPQAAPRCPLTLLTTTNTFGGSRCPLNSAVGVLSLVGTGGTGKTAFGGRDMPVYNLETEPGTPAQFGASVAVGITAIIKGTTIHTPHGYALRVTSVLAGQHADEIGGFTLGFYGNPAAEYHTGATPTAFLANPSSCANGEAERTLTIHSDAWGQPAEGAGDPLHVTSFSDPNWQVQTATLPQFTGCAALAGHFNPAFSFQPESHQAASPSAYTAELKVPQNEDPAQLATPHLRKAVVTLPKGIAVNPSAAAGLGACSEEQVGLEDTLQPTCPDSSKIGTAEVITPLLERPLVGQIFVASQEANPFHSLLALYLVVNDPTTGVVVKLPGKVEADEHTGQLTATFDENPQLPFSNLNLKFKGGNRAPLSTPDTCGAFKTTGEFTPWSAPESGPPATTEDEFQVTQGPGGSSSCPTTKAQRPFHPGFEAGTTSTNAGTYAPFTLKVSRSDGEQELKRLEFTLPKGLLGRLAGVPVCSEAQIAAAKAKSGREEQSNPSCPSGSQIGSVQTGAGVGNTPIYVGGKVYLAGPYEGAPTSAVVITPAVAGPFDLGDVVVRAPIYVNPETAQLRTKSDEIPSIIKGIPLQIRRIQIEVNRPSFTLNPTSCEKQTVTATLTGAEASANASNPFQVGNCGALGFKPKLSGSLKGGTKRSDHPALTATLTYPQGAYANIASAAVTLPHSEFLDQAHIRTVCTRVQFAANACPQGAIYGTAEATTPLIDGKLTGPVYLRSSSNKLPDLVVALKGPASQPVEVNLDGRIDSIHGGIRTTFEAVPDAPVSQFTLHMQGGKKGLLVNSRNLCSAGGGQMTVRLIAHNGKRHDEFPALRNECGKAGHKKVKKHHEKSHKRRALSQLLAAW